MYYMKKRIARGLAPVLVASGLLFGAVGVTTAPSAEAASRCSAGYDEEHKISYHYNCVDYIATSTTITVTVTDPADRSLKFALQATKKGSKWNNGTPWSSTRTVAPRFTGKIKPSWTGVKVGTKFRVVYTSLSCSQYGCLDNTADYTVKGAKKA
jgi:hypothetical protein